jgi:hypothetical protein
MALTHKHIFSLECAAPLIYHVFNVEQDQVIRDNKFDIREGRAEETENEKQKPVKVMNCRIEPGHPQVQVSIFSFRCHFRL